MLHKPNSYNINLLLFILHGIHITPDYIDNEFQKLNSLPDFKLTSAQSTYLTIHHFHILCYSLPIEWTEGFR